MNLKNTISPVVGKEHTDHTTLVHTTLVDHRPPDTGASNDGPIASNDAENPIFQQSGDFHASVYNQLRQLAAGWLGRWRSGQTLQPTELVHEAYLRMQKQNLLDCSQRVHFFGAAARAMHQLLVDHARKRSARKRGGDLQRVPLSMSIPGLHKTWAPEEVLTVHAMIEQLGAEYPDHAQVVMLNYFAGLTHKHIASLTGVSERTVGRRWEFARAWMQARLQSI